MKFDEFKAKYKDEPEFAGVLHYLTSHGFEKREIMFNFIEAKRKMGLWHHKLNRYTEQSSGKTELILTFSDGFYWVELQDYISKMYESHKMNNCVSTFSDEDHVCSLRDKNNKPHVSIYFRNGIAQEIRGVGNGTVSPRFLEKVIVLLNYVQAELPNNVKKIMGYVNLDAYVSKMIKNYFKGYVFVNIFGKEYLYIGSKIKQFKKIEMFDIKLYDHLCNTMQCDSALRELVVFENADAILLTNTLLDQAILDNNIKMVDYLLSNTKYSLSPEFLISLEYDFSWSWCPDILSLIVEKTNISKKQLDEILYKIYVEKFDDLVNRNLFVRMKSLIKNCSLIRIDDQTVNMLNNSYNHVDGIVFLIQNGLDLRNAFVRDAIVRLSKNKEDLSILIYLNKEIPIGLDFLIDKRINFDFIKNKLKNMLEHNNEYFGQSTEEYLNEIKTLELDLKANCDYWFLDGKTPEELIKIYLG